MTRANDKGRTAAAMDVLAPGIGEIIGGSQREERLAVLDARMAECHHRPGALRPHPSLDCVTGLANVSDAIPFPRTPGTRGI